MSGHDDSDGDDEGIALIVPPLGESIPEATLSRWVRRSGDFVEKDQPVVELESDKITVELEAPASGVLLVRRPLADLVKVGDIVARIVPAPPGDRSREARHDELLAAIAAAPDDEGARQVYADFLLEAACPLRTWGAETTALRGEYLSLVVRQKRPRAGDDLQAIAARRAELESVGHDTARSLVPMQTGHLQVEDGFVVGIQADLATVVAHGDVFAHAPIRSLRVSDIAADAGERLLALPRLEQLRMLTLVGQSARRELPDDAIASIVESPRLAGIHRLELRALPLSPRMFAALSRTPARVVELHDCIATTAETLGDRAFDRLAITDTRRWAADALRATLARPVRELALAGTGAPPPFDASMLEMLVLEGYALDAQQHGARLAAAKHLRELQLNRCWFRDLTELCGIVAVLPQSVQTLVLRGALVGNRGAEAYENEVRARTTAEVIF